MTEKPTRLKTWEVWPLCVEINMPIPVIYLLERIVECIGDHGNCWKAQKFLSEELYRDPSQINRWVKELVEHNIITYKVEFCKAPGYEGYNLAFRLVSLDFKDAIPWPSRKYEPGTRTTRNGATVTITEDKIVTVTPPPDNLESITVDGESIPIDGESIGQLTESQSQLTESQSEIDGESIPHKRAFKSKKKSKSSKSKKSDEYHCIETV